jgi:ABC-2 type transport system ATP-binding protein
MRENVVEVRSLTRYFGARPAAYEVSFSVGRGEVFALVGPNGAGKTTILSMLVGMLEPTRGSAGLFGCECRALPSALRARVAYLAEGHHLYDWMRIRDLADFTRGTHPRWDGQRFRGFLEYFRLGEKERIGSLSNGQRAQVSLSAALACNPELLIMDDPTLGVDAATRREFLRGIVDLVSREGRTVLFSSHLLSDVERVADRIGILVDGVLRADLPLEEFKRSMVRYHLTFEGNVPTDLALPRAVSTTVLGREVHVTVVKPGQDIDEALTHLGAASSEQEGLSLEDAFIDYTAGGGRRLPIGLFPSLEGRQGDV